MSSERFLHGNFDDSSRPSTSQETGTYPDGLMIPEPMWFGEFNGRHVMNIGPEIDGASRKILERRLKNLPPDLQEQYRMRYADMLPRAKFIAGQGLYFFSGTGEIPLLEMIPHVGIIENPSPESLDDKIQAIRISESPEEKDVFVFECETFQEGGSFTDENGVRKNAVLTSGIRLGRASFEDLSAGFEMLKATKSLTGRNARRLASPYLKIKLIDCTDEDFGDGDTGIASGSPDGNSPTDLIND